MIQSTIEQLTDNLNLSPSQVNLASLYEEKLKEQAKYDKLSKKKTFKQAKREAINKYLTDLRKYILVSDIKRLSKEGMSQRKIAETLNVSLGMINQILH